MQEAPYVDNGRVTPADQPERDLLASCTLSHKGHDVKTMVFFYPRSRTNSPPYLPESAHALPDRNPALNQRPDPSRNPRLI